MRKNSASKGWGAITALLAIVATHEVTPLEMPLELIEFVIGAKNNPFSRRTAFAISTFLTRRMCASKIQSVWLTGAGGKLAILLFFLAFPSNGQ
jgi:hypothetical protein